MGILVALDCPGGPEFVRQLEVIWDRGDAALPVDQRLPAAARDALLTSMRVGDEVADGDALVLATSGTTGRPKGVVLTHDAIRTSSVATSSRLDVDPSRDTWLACLPLAHIGGLGVVLRARHLGTGLEVHDGFDAARVNNSSATLVSLVPAVLPRIDTTAFRRILLGGSAIPADRPSNALATYGMTESCGGVVYDGVPLDGVEVRVRPAASGSEPGEGEIELRGPMLLRTYRDGTDPRDGDGWYRTGDIGTVVDGVLRVSGRSSDMIISGGENVWPAPVEQIVAEHPAVAAVAVVGRPDAEWGQRVTAVIEVVEGADLPRLVDLRDRVKASLPAFCAPRAIEVVETLPRTALGKIVRSAL